VTAARANGANFLNMVMILDKGLTGDNA
jgi:hypothetical protein